MTPANLSVVMRRFDFVRETAPNAGFWVNLFQRFTGNSEGESWCCSMLCFCLDVAYKGKSPYRKSGACADILAQATKLGHVVTTAQVDDIFFYVDDSGHAHHTGSVTAINPLRGIAGNTSEDGVSSNGTGVFEHSLNVAPQHIRFVRVPA